ncbi:unnamed protein product [Linum trigynum]|uniref:Uncharacterized protein n=1 Tax=Linum trigynum TaxID=586398 RepID=A0AAV2D8L9_9ROSI
MYVFVDEDEELHCAPSSTVTDAMTGKQSELRRSARVRELHDEELECEEEEEEEDGEEIALEDDEDVVVAGRTYLDDEE